VDFSRAISEAHDRSAIGSAERNTALAIYEHPVSQQVIPYDVFNSNK
jgi:hypothetical protein